jgi:hypothetical protein
VAVEEGTMGRILMMYGIGFGTVYVLILVGWMVARVARHMGRDWDRAFALELLGHRIAGRETSAPWESDPLT